MTNDERTYLNTVFNRILDRVGPCQITVDGDDLTGRPMSGILDECADFDEVYVRFIPLDKAYCRVRLLVVPDHNVGEDADQVIADYASPALDFWSSVIDGD